MDGEDELEVPRDRLLRVEKRRQLEADAFVLRRPVVGVDVCVERLCRAGRVDGRLRTQRICHLARLV